MEDCDTDIKQLKKLMHGRKRSDMRVRWKRRTAWLEQMTAKGKAGKIIKAVLKSQAGKKHRKGLCLDTVQDSQGTVHVTPHSVHKASNSTFDDWYAMPP